MKRRQSLLTSTALLLKNVPLFEEIKSIHFVIAVTNKGRPNIPEVNNSMYRRFLHLMEICWDNDPLKRPKSDSLRKHFAKRPSPITSSNTYDLLSSLMLDICCKGNNKTIITLTYFCIFLSLYNFGFFSQKLQGNVFSPTTGKLLSLRYKNYDNLHLNSLKSYENLVFRSSHPEVLCKKGAARNFIKKRLWYRPFSMSFAKFLRTNFFIEHL